MPSLLARISSLPCGGTISHSRDLRYKHMSMRSTSFISPRHSVCTLPLRSILCTSCCVSFFVVAITPNTRRGPAVITGPLVCKIRNQEVIQNASVEKEKPWHGLALECLRRTRTRFSALCYAVCYLVHHRHNKPRLRPIRCHSWRVDSTLSTFASLCLYSTTLFGRKTCKVSKEKAAIAGRQLFPLILLRHPARRSTRQPLHRGYHFP